MVATLENDTSLRGPGFKSVFGEAAEGALKARDAFISGNICKYLQHTKPDLSQETLAAFKESFLKRIETLRNNDGDFSIDLQVLKENGIPEYDRVKKRIADVFEAILLQAHRHIAMDSAYEALKTANISLNRMESIEMETAIQRVYLGEPSLYPTCAARLEVKKRAPNC